MDRILSPKISFANETVTKEGMSWEAPGAIQIAVSV